MPSRAIPYLALVLGVLAFSTSGVLARLCSAPAVTIAFWVRVFSLLYLAAVLFFRDGRRSASSLRAAGGPGLAGGVLFGVHVVLYFSALKLTSITVVFLITALNPAMVGLFGWLLLGERLSLAQALWTAAAIGAAGLVVVARGEGGVTNVLGNLVAVASAVTYCAYFLASRRARRTTGATEYMAVVQIAAIAVVGLIALASGTPLAVASRTEVFWVAVLALVPATMGHLSVNWSLRHVEAHAAATVLLAVPLFASLWAHLFVDERLSAAQIVAGALVLASIPGAIRPSPPDLVKIPTDPGGELPTEPEHP